MDPERWKIVDGIFQSVLDRPPGERDAFLRHACAGDGTLEQEVRSLLTSERLRARLQAGGIPAGRAAAGGRAGGVPVRRAQSGTTLFELLIAVTLVSFLAVGIMTAMRVGLNAKSKTDDRLLGNRKAAAVERVLAAEVAGFMPISADCQGVPGARFGFFEGRSNEMRFVSSYSLQEAARGYPRVLEFRVIPGERGEGVRLIVNELFYTGPSSLGQLCAALEPEPGAGGAIAQIDLLQAQRDAFQAEVTRIRTDANLLNARAQLLISSGRSLIH